MTRVYVSTMTVFIFQKEEGVEMMQQVYVKFESAEQIVNFVNVLNRFDEKFDLIADKSRINAKSLLGIFSLDLTKAYPLRYDSYNQDIWNKIRPFMYKKDSRHMVN